MSKRRIHRRFGEHPHAEIITSVDGFGPVLGAELLADTGGDLAALSSIRRPDGPSRAFRTRGRIWLATRPEAVLWLESAGGSLQVGHDGDWLAADPDGWEHANPERRTAAALHWDDRFGDRAQELTILTHDADPDAIQAGLRAALLTDAELAAGEEEWRHYPDPFGWWHTDPCDDVAAARVQARHQEDQA